VIGKARSRDRAAPFTAELKRARQAEAQSHHNWLYMNASRLRQCFVCSDIDRVGCSCISGLVAADTAAAGPDEIR
jgi:hypothetical protein